jgi:hypothetical protein
MAVIFRWIALQVFRVPVSFPAFIRTDAASSALHREFDCRLCRSGGEFLDDDAAELPAAQLLVVLIQQRSEVKMQTSPCDDAIRVSVARRRRRDSLRAPLVDPFLRRPAVEDVLFADRVEPLVDLAGDGLQLRPRIRREEMPLRGIPLRSVEKDDRVAERLPGTYTTNLDNGVVLVMRERRDLLVKVKRDAIQISSPFRDRGSSRSCPADPSAFPSRWGS